MQWLNYVCRCVHNLVFNEDRMSEHESEIEALNVEVWNEWSFTSRTVTESRRGA